MGNLSEGLHAILPELADDQTRQFMIHIHVIRFPTLSIYCRCYFCVIMVPVYSNNESENYVIK